MNNCKSFLFLLLAAFTAATPLTAQVYPLTENSFGNPEFMKRFLGSYGVRSELEPQISRDEATLMQELATLLETNQLAAAATRLRSAITPESSAALEYTLGNILFQQGQIEATIRHYEAAIRKFPDFLRAYGNLGRVYVQLGRFDEAITMLAKALELGGGDSDLYGLLGYSYLNSGQYDSAIDAYSVARLLNPSSRDWQVGRAQALLMAEHYDRAIAALKELIERFPDDSQFYLNLANAYLGKGEIMESAIALDMVRRMGKASANSLLLLADIYMNERLFKLALETYLAAFEGGDPVPPSRQVRIARLFIERLEDEKAEAILNQISANPAFLAGGSNRLDYLNALAELRMLQGAGSEVVALLEEVIEVQPMNGSALLTLGRQLNSMGDYEQAAYFFSRAATVSDFRSRALLEHGRMLVAQKDFEKALPLLQEAQDLNPSDSLKRYIEAVESILESIRR